MAYRYWNRGAGQAKTAAAKERYAQNKLAKKFAALGVKNGQLQLPPWIDNWYELAEYLYGDQRYAEQLAAANGGLSILQPGQMITVPNIPLGLGQDLAVSYDFMVATAQMGAQLAAAGSTNPLAGFDPDYLANQINQGVVSGTVSASYAEYLLGGLNYAVEGNYGVAPPLPAGVAGGGEAGAGPGGVSGGAVGPGGFGGTDTATGSFLNLPGGGVSTGVVPGAPQVPQIAGPQPPTTMAAAGYSPTAATQGIGAPLPPPPDFARAREAAGVPAPSAYPVPGALPPTQAPPSFESDVTTTPTEARAAQGLEGPDATLFFPDTQNFFVAFDDEGNLVNPDVLPNTLTDTDIQFFFMDEEGVISPFIYAYYQPIVGTGVWRLLPQMAQLKSSGFGGVAPNPNFRPNLLSPWWAYQQRTGWGEFEFTSQQKRDPYNTERNGNGGGEGHGGSQAVWMVGWD